MGESPHTGVDVSVSEPVSSLLEDTATETDVSEASLVQDNSDEKKHKKKKKKWEEKFVDVDLDASGGPSPIDTKTNIFSLLTYWWTGSILAKGYTRPLSVS